MKNDPFRNNLDVIWLKSAVLGGLWASVEIIIGSLFHNLRIPFAGSVLAMNGTILMVAFYQIWPVKGLIWRAGLICALMKSVSPSAVILGPMIGILIEAFIIEFFIRYFGNNLVSLSVAGALSVSSALIHKIASLIILYGFNIVNIYVDIFRFLAKQVKIEHADPWTLVTIILITYSLLGIFSAVSGFFVGRQAVAKTPEYLDQKRKQMEHKNILSIDPLQKFSVILFFIHLLIIPTGLWIINFAGPTLSLPVIVTYILFNVYKYKQSFRRLLKFVFWIQLLIVVILASIDWKGFSFQGSSLFYKEGFLIGLKMVFRAVFVVVAFSSFSIELRNPVVRELLFKKGFDTIYNTLKLSFAVLPLMINALPEPRRFFSHPLNSFTQMIRQARSWLLVFEEMNQQEIIQSK